MTGSAPKLTVVDGGLPPDTLNDFDRRGLPGNLRFAANVVEREMPHETWVVRTLRLLADELTPEEGK